MPTPADQLPTNISTLARKLASLEREVRELRAGRRLANAAVDGGSLTVRDLEEPNKRIVLTSRGGESGNQPAAQFHSGLPSEVHPGEIAAYTDGGQEFGYIKVTAPDFTTDDLDDPASLYLQSGVGDTRPVFLLSSGDSRTGGWTSIQGSGSDIDPDGSISVLIHSIVDSNSELTSFDIQQNGIVFDQWDADHGPLEYLDGIFKVPSERFGRVTITPAGDGIVTSMGVTGLGLPGTNFYGFVSARSTVPGDRKPAPGGTLRGITGVSCDGETSDGMTVYVNRQNTTDTIVNWWIKGE